MVCRNDQRDLAPVVQFREWLHSRVGEDPFIAPWRPARQ
jgi:hypothetical protein